LLHRDKTDSPLVDGHHPANSGNFRQDRRIFQPVRPFAISGLSHPATLNEIDDPEQNHRTDHCGKQIHDPAGVSFQVPGVFADRAADHAAGNANKDIPEDGHLQQPLDILGLI